MKHKVGKETDGRSKKSKEVGNDNSLTSMLTKTYYQAFWGVLIDFIVELLDLIIKSFDNQAESWNPVSNDLIIKSFNTIIWNSERI